MLLASVRFYVRYAFICIAAGNGSMAWKRHSLPARAVAIPRIPRPACPIICHRLLTLFYICWFSLRHQGGEQLADQFIYCARPDFGNGAVLLCRLVLTVAFSPADPSTAGDCTDFDQGLHLRPDPQFQLSDVVCRQHYVDIVERFHVPKLSGHEGGRIHGGHSDPNPA